MTTEIRVPALGELVTEATVAKWMKAVGDAVAVDEPLVELETDKVTLEVPSPVAGVLAEIAVGEGSDVQVGAVLGSIDGATAAPGKPAESTEAAAEPVEAAKPPIEAPARQPAPTRAPPPSPSAGNVVAMLSPAVRKLIEEHNLDPASIPASGKDGRLTKGDVLDFVQNQGSGPAPGGVRPAAVSYEAASPSPPPRPMPAAAALAPRPAPAPTEPHNRRRRARSACG